MLKTYSNSFLNLLILTWQKAFIYLNVFINIYFMDIITQKVFIKYIFILQEAIMPDYSKYLKSISQTAMFILNGYNINYKLNLRRLK